MEKIKLFGKDKISQIDIDRIFGGSGEPGEYHETTNSQGTTCWNGLGWDCDTAEFGDTYPSDC